jgi:hypothetical protein
VETSKPISLDYATSDLRPRRSKAAIAAYVFGIISGPLGGVLVVPFLLSPTVTGLQLLPVFLGVPLSAVVFGFVTRTRIKRTGDLLRGSGLALAGAVIAVVWIVAVLVLMWVLP